MNSIHDRERVLILGGGVGGLEAMMALNDLAGELVEVTLVSPNPEFVLKPMIVKEPFSLDPAERRDMASVARRFEARFVPGAAALVIPAEQEVELADSSRLGYDHLVVALGAKSRPALRGAETFWAGQGQLPIDSLVRTAAAEPSKTITFVVPSGCSWPLPLYELALLSRKRADLLGHRDLSLEICSPEDSPLSIFGPAASEPVSRVLSGRRIGFSGSATVVEDAEGAMSLRPGGDRLEAGVVISIPTLYGPSIPGLPEDDDGFLPIDTSCRLEGFENVYAVGDGSSFPIKQGGLATQQADAAAARIAESAGADILAEEFHPVLRGQLLVGDESLFLRHDLTGGHGDGAASLDCLWWPPGKVSGRYLTPWLTGIGHVADAEPPIRPIEVEVAIPPEWHGTPVAMGPHPNPL